MRALGVYGGTFDPPHLGHLLAAAWALAAGPLDELAVFPSAHHPLGKRPQASFAQRVAMCRATFGELHHVRVDELEATLGEQGFTLTLLRALREREGERPLRLVVGQDILAQTSRWHAWDEVCRLAPPLIVGRQGIESSSAQVALRMPEVSSSLIRARLARDEDVSGLVHHDVLMQLKQDNAYIDLATQEHGA